MRASARDGLGLMRPGARPPPSSTFSDVKQALGAMRVPYRNQPPAPSLSAPHKELVVIGHQQAPSEPERPGLERRGMNRGARGPSLPGRGPPSPLGSRPARCSSVPRSSSPPGGWQVPGLPAGPQPSSFGLGAGVLLTLLLFSKHVFIFLAISGQSWQRDPSLWHAGSAAPGRVGLSSRVEPESSALEGGFSTPGPPRQSLQTPLCDRR